MQPDITPLKPTDHFTFACGPGLTCFNQCCRDLNQLLTPYDILRLKTGLGLTSGQFLERYTLEHTGPQTGLPVVALKPGERIDRCCPFVTTIGCAVYHDRPSSCRLYPLMRVAARSRADAEISVRFEGSRM